MATVRTFEKIISMLKLVAVAERVVQTGYFFTDAFN